MDRRIILHLAMAFGISWAIAAVGALLGVRSAEHPAYIVVAALFMFGPAVAGGISLRVRDHGPWQVLGLRWAGTNWRAVFATMAIGLCIVPGTLLTMALLGDGLGLAAFGHVSITAERMVTSVTEIAEKSGMALPSGQLDALTAIPAGAILVICLLAALVAACSVNLPFMLGEELGWRGYLFLRTAHWPGMQRVLFTGVVWGLWHAPLIAMGHNYPGYPVAGVGMMVLFCVALAFLFDHARLRSKSIWAPAILHGILNGSAGAMVLFAWGGHLLVGSVVGVAALIAIAGLVGIVLVVDGNYRGRLFRSSPAVGADQAPASAGTTSIVMPS